jgi:hypothetical protein
LKLKYRPASSRWYPSFCCLRLEVETEVPTGIKPVVSLVWLSSPVG